jgi:dipeptidyl aminopeptidase/acylaminoacyl peptidase
MPMHRFCIPVLSGAGLLWLALLPLTVWGSSELRPFTVTDSIEMTQIVDPELPNTGWLPSKKAKFKRSPDGKKIAMVVRRGNLGTGFNEYALWSFDVGDLLRFIRSRSTRYPTASVLAQFATESSDDAIDQVRWIRGGQAIAFVGRAPNRPAQVFAVDVETKRLTQLTHDEGDVIRFGLSPDGKVAVYAAGIVPDLTAKRRYGWTVTSSPVWALSAASGDQVFPALYGYFVLHVDTGAKIPVDLEPTWFPQELAISPTGKSAIVAHPVKMFPESWSGYDFIQRRIARQRDALFCSTGVRPSNLGSLSGDDTFAASMDDVGMFHLIDLASGAAKPLVVAPAIIPAADPDTKSGGWDRGSVSWSADGTTVLLPPSLMPLDSALSDDHRKRRKEMLAIYSVDIPSGSTAVVADLTSYVSTDNWEFMPLIPYAMETSAQYVSSDTIAVAISAPDGTQGRTTRYARRGGKWIAAGTVKRGPDIGVELDVRQDLNTPPDVFATEIATRKSKRITDLNPKLRELTLARVEAFNWTDRLGVRRKGGLFLPPGHVFGQRLPVVIQMGGFNRNEFQVDGPQQITTAMAAQALANKDILVLQAPDFWNPASPVAGCEQPREVVTEADQVIAGLEAAIDALDAAGLIDRGRVGLLGFSRTGMNVHEFLAFSSYPIAAATVADSVAMTPSNYAGMYGIAFPGMLEFESAEVMGAPFWGPGVETWRKRSYFFNLDRIRTPIRYEHNWTLMPTQWDPYAILKRMQRPVEFVHFPINQHILRTPDTRYTSQQGNVDWFGFWLKGEERSDADVDRSRPGDSLSEQYRRWRGLREQFDALKSTAQTSVGRPGSEKSAPGNME